MSQKILYFSSIILLIIFKFSHQLFSKPDLENPSTLQKWRELCGFRYLPKKLVFAEQCFGSGFKDRWVAFPDSLIEPKNRVLGGREVKYHESPWTVQIVEKEYVWVPKKGQSFYCSTLCTGVLLTMKHVLTAAHCWKKKISVFAGNDLFAQGWSTDKLTFHQHPRYINRTFPNGTKEYDQDYDIGIIKFNTAIDWDKYGLDKSTGKLIINTICLPKPEISDEPTFWENYQRATFFGWGRVSVAQYPYILQRGDALVKHSSGRVLDSTFPYFEFKADGYEPRICAGDSGSGLVQYLDNYRMRAVLIGTMSRTIKKLENVSIPLCNYEHMGVSRAIRVVNHLKWIYERLGEN